MVRMLLEEDRGSEGQSSWQSGVGEGGVQGRDVQGVSAEEFRNGVGKRREGKLRQRRARGARGGAQRGKRAAVSSRVRRAAARARHQQLRGRREGVRSVPDAAGARHRSAAKQLTVRAATGGSRLRQIRWEHDFLRLCFLAFHLKQKHGGFKSSPLIASRVEVGLLNN